MTARKSPSFDRSHQGTDEVQALGANPQVDESADPTWPILIVTGLVAGGLLGSGLAAMAGVLSVWLVAPATVLGIVVTLRFAPRRVAVKGGPTPMLVWGSLAIFLAVWTGWNVAHASELVITGRDGSTYLTISRWLVGESQLLPNVTSQFGGAEPLGFEAPGWILRDDGRLYQQFLHALPALWAIVARVAGLGALLWSNVVIGAAALLALFALMRRWLSSWMALGAVFTLAGALPMIYYSRTTFAEPAALMAMVTGLWLAVDGVERDDRAASRVGGMILGLTTLVRIDAWIVGVALAWALVLDKAMSDEESSTKHVWTGFLAVGVVGLVDLVAFSTPYLQMHRQQMFMLFVAILAGRVAASPLFSSLLRRLRPLLRKWFGGAGAVLTALLSIYLFVVRPLFMPSYGGGYGLAGIEAFEGLPVESGRNYLEMAGWWQIWYLGVPIVLAALCVAIVGAWHAKPVATPARRLVLISAALPVILYLLKPSANPDHVWVMRRYLTSALPVFIALAWVGLGWLRSRFHDARVRSISIAAGSLALMASPVVATLPLANVVDGAGSIEMIESICTQVDSRPVLLVQEDAQLDTFLMQPIRVWCGVPTATVAADDLEQVLDHLSVPVHLIAAEADVLPQDRNVQPLVDTQVSFIQETLVSSPWTTRTVPIELSIAEAGPEGE